MNSSRFSQKPSTTSGALSLKSSQLKNWLRSFGQFGLVTTSAIAPPKKMTVDAVAMAAPLAPSCWRKAENRPDARRLDGGGRSAVT